MGKSKQTIFGKRVAQSLISITTLLLQTERVRYRPRYNAHRAYTLPFGHFKPIFSRILRSHSLLSTHHTSQSIRHLRTLTFHLLTRRRPSRLSYPVLSYRIIQSGVLRSINCPPRHGQDYSNGGNPSQLHRCFNLHIGRSRLNTC